MFEKASGLREHFIKQHRNWQQQLRGKRGCRHFSPGWTPQRPTRGCGVNIQFEPLSNVEKQDIQPHLVTVVLMGSSCGDSWFAQCPQSFEQLPDPPFAAKSNSDYTVAQVNVLTARTHLSALYSPSAASSCYKHCLSLQADQPHLAQLSSSKARIPDLSKHGSTGSAGVLPAWPLKEGRWGVLSQCPTKITKVISNFWQQVWS